jgi:protein-S-isoprenylcysteine O-methyltransferase Ste14
VLLTEILFLRVSTVPLAGEAQKEEANLAFTLLKYFSFFPLVPFLAVVAERWLERSAWHSLIIVVVVCGAQWALHWRHRAAVKEQAAFFDAESRESEMFTQLGLV